MNVALFPREDGRYGVRNRIAVIATVACVNHVVEQIAAEVPGADAYTHAYGCDQLGFDRALSEQSLLEMAIHPNQGAALVIGLGCEEIDAARLCGNIRKSRSLVDYLIMQEAGGTATTIAKGVAICKDFAAKLRQQQRVEVDVSNLTVAVECGGSDFSSGIAANPAVGVFTEKLTNAGGKVVFGETAELMGAEDVLRKRSISKEVYETIEAAIRRVEDTALFYKEDLRGTQPSPGNIAGGLSTIEEKSLGGVCKIGQARIVDAIAFGQRATKPGVTYVDTPGNDLACTLGLCAAGAQIVIFTTGRGTPMGFAAAPVFKMTANHGVYCRMRENFDLDVSGILDRTSSVREEGEKLWEAILQVAEGKETAAETLGHREFSLYRISPILT